MAPWDPILRGLHVLRGAVAGLSGSPPEKGPYRERKLTADEIVYADRVFAGTIGLDRVSVASDIGLFDRPYTLPKWRRRDGYVIHLGPEGFADARTPTLVHELTHVWQSSHAPWRWTYVIRSMSAQAWSWVKTRSTDGAYRYQVGGAWNGYGVEQQASVVEDWFEPSGWTTWDGCPPGQGSESDPRFRYLRDDIRTGSRG